MVLFEGRSTLYEKEKNIGIVDCYYISVAVKMKTASYVSKGKIKVSWEKRSTASGYLIKYCTSTKFPNNGRTNTITIKSASTTYKIISNLAKATYYIRVVPYKTAKGK
ncbi:MAG: hypothetical protein Q4F79_12150 [Eubacteriales bacterium]|nr:hypothetical protein [Eubacteriales bacterium]